MSDAWLRTCRRCGETVDVSEGESEADVAGILLSHLALDCRGNLELRAPDSGITYDPPRDDRQNEVIDDLRGRAPGTPAGEGYFERWDLVSVGGIILRTHHERLCRPPCCLHSPSEHHMREWQQAWSQQLLAVFRRCPHGHFHPDPDDLQARTGGLLHTCDGCCLAPPG